MEDKEGWVYILTNEAMPGLVKVGYTMKDPAIRAEELYKDSKTGAVTGVPMPFVVVYKALVVNPYQVEQAVHKELESKRINNNREFFKCELSETIAAIQQVTTVKYEDAKHRDSLTKDTSKEVDFENDANNSEEIKPIAYEMADGGEYLGSLNEQRRPHGYGTRKYGDGAKYEGYFENGHFHGQGTFNWADGHKYIGRWNNGIMEDSYAQFFYPDGHKYYGGFQDDKRHGSGTMSCPDGKQRSGRWKNGELVKWDSSPTENGFEAFQYIYGGFGLVLLIGFYLYYFLF